MKKTGPSWQQHFPLVTQRETRAMCRHWEFWHERVLYVHTSPEQPEFNQGDNFQALQQILKISESSALMTCAKSPSSLTSSLTIGTYTWKQTMTMAPDRWKVTAATGHSYAANISLLYSEGLPQVLLKADISLTQGPNSKSISSAKFRAQRAT